MPPHLLLEFARWGGALAVVGGLLGFATGSPSCDQLAGTSIQLSCHNWAGTVSGSEGGLSPKAEAELRAVGLGAFGGVLVGLAFPALRKAAGGEGA